MNDDTDFEQEEKSKPSSPWPVAALLVLVFLPATIIATVLYFLLRKGRQHLTVIASVSALLLAAACGVFSFGKAWPQALATFDALLAMDWDAWPGILPLYAVVNLALGAVGGLVLAALEVHQMKANPHRLQLRGNWMYGFKYRRTPVQVLRRRKAITGLKSGWFATDDRAPLGLDEEGDTVVHRHDAETVKHTLISGAAGSGKTVTLLSLIRADIQSGKPVFIIDFKRSPEVAAKLAAWAKENDAEFYHFVNGDPSTYDVEHSPGQAFYDPLRSGSPTAKADMVLGMREYDTASAVYRANMQQLLQVVFAALDEADQAAAPAIRWNAGGVQQLASAISGTNLKQLAEACKHSSVYSSIAAVAEAAAGRTPIRHAVEELQGQLRTLVASEYGRWLRQDPAGVNIDIFQQARTSRSVVLFSLNSDSEPEFARYVGSMILADFTSLSAQRRNAGDKNQVNIYVDEFQAVPPTAVTSLLEKSRESRMGMTLAQQSFEQIISASERNGEAYLLSILDTCSNFIVHNGMTEDSAVRLSKVLGKHWVTAYRQTNQNESFFLSLNFKNRRQQAVSTSEEERWVFEPRQFMKLSSPDKNNGYRATAVLVNKTSADPRFAGREGALARTVWMLPNNQVVADYYKPKMLTASRSRSEVSTYEGLAPLAPVADEVAPAVEAPPVEGSPSTFAAVEPVLPAPAAESPFASFEVAEDGDALPDLEELLSTPPSDSAADDLTLPDLFLTEPKEYDHD